MRLLIVTVVVLGTLTACASAPAPAPAPTSTPTSTSVVTSSLTCQQFGEAASVIVASTLGNAQGTVTAEKMASELERAKTLLDSIEVQPGTDLAAAVEALRPITAEDLAAEAEDGPESEWDRQFAAFVATCEAEGDTVELSMPGG